MKRCRLIAALLAGLLCVLVTTSALGAGENQQRIRKLEIAYILNFAKFISWPESALAKGSPLIIGIYGDNPFQGLLADLDGKNVRGHTIQTRLVTNLEESSACHILFIPRSRKEDAAALLTGLRRKPVATISTIAGFASEGGTIELLSQDNHVLFAINNFSAQQKGLTIPSQVLALAVEVFVALP